MANDRWRWIGRRWRRFAHHLDDPAASAASADLIIGSQLDITARRVVIDYSDVVVQQHESWKVSRCWCCVGFDSRLIVGYCQMLGGCLVRPEARPANWRDRLTATWHRRRIERSFYQYVLISEISTASPSKPPREWRNGKTSVKKWDQYWAFKFYIIIIIFIIPVAFDSIKDSVSIMKWPATATILAAFILYILPSWLSDFLSTDGIVFTRIQIHNCSPQFMRQWARRCWMAQLY